MQDKPAWLVKLEALKLDADPDHNERLKDHLTAYFVRHETPEDTIVAILDSGALVPCIPAYALAAPGAVAGGPSAMVAGSSTTPAGPLAMAAAASAMAPGNAILTLAKSIESVGELAKPIESLSGALMTAATLRTAPAKQGPRAMSEVGSHEAGAIVSYAGFHVVDGNKLSEYKIVPPEGGFPCQPDFEADQYANEQAATVPFIEYLKARLMSLGVELDIEGGVEVHDAHKNQGCLKLTFPEDAPLDNRDFTGSMDLSFTPYGSMDVVRQCRVGGELKHNDNDKLRFEQGDSSAGTQRKRARLDTTIEEGGTAAGGGAEASVPDADFSFTEYIQGQATLQTLSIYGLAHFPALFFITDGHTYHLLRMHGDLLIIWEDLSQDAALYKIAQVLKSLTAEQRRVNMTLDPEATDDDTKPLKLMRQFHPSTHILQQMSRWMDLAEGGSEVADACAFLRMQPSPAAVAEALFGQPQFEHM